MIDYGTIEQETRVWEGLLKLGFAKRRGEQ
jgi:hypothetical protein